MWDWDLKLSVFSKCNDNMKAVFELRTMHNMPVFFSVSERCSQPSRSSDSDRPCPQEQETCTEKGSYLFVQQPPWTPAARPRTGLMSSKMRRE